MPAARVSDAVVPAEAERLGYSCQGQVVSCCTTDTFPTELPVRETVVSVKALTIGKCFCFKVD